MDELGIAKADPRVLFGQLLGMRDHLTYPIGQAGYNAYKVLFIKFLKLITFESNKIL